MPDTVLVTGGAGYIGSHIVVELARAGYSIEVHTQVGKGTRFVISPVKM